MELRGDALRADLRRICSLASVMPRMGPAADLDDEAVRQRQVRHVVDRTKAKEAMQRRRAKGMAERPDGCLTVLEASKLAKCSAGHVGAKLRSLNIEPVLCGIFKWYRRADLVRAGVLRDPRYASPADIARARKVSRVTVSEHIKRHGIVNRGTKSRCLYLVEDLVTAGILPQVG